MTQSDTDQSPPVFRIGLAMAGAVSAGAYTAGVIDYLLQTLDAWEQKKQQNRAIEQQYGRKDVSKGYDPSIPMHDVQIEVIGGASAGGITAALTLVNLLQGFRPASEEAPNLLYDCWVNLNDQPEASTLQQMLSKTDLSEDSTHIYSLLNASPIDAIAQKALQATADGELPGYISKNLEVLLTLTSLRSIPLAVNFYDKVKLPEDRNRSAPAHRMHLHRAVAHFRLGDELYPPPHVFPFDRHSREDREKLIDFAIASGAFPLGLQPRLIRGTPLNYIQAMTNRMFRSDSDQQAFFDVLAQSDPFDFVAVDGGTINNEPFGEIIDVLEEKCREDQSDYAVIMIDPFPNFQEEVEEPELKGLPSVAQQVPGILGAIRGQAMMKESEIARGFSGDYSRRMIFPKREEDPYPISCGALDGFGGFFEKSFRIHDFQLGRKNCQGFLRKYLAVRLEDLEQLGVFRDWEIGDPRHERFYIPDKYGQAGYYPLIPDVRASRDPEADPTKLGIPDRKPIAAQSILALQPAIQERVKAMLLKGQEQVTASKPDKEKPEEVNWANRQMASRFGNQMRMGFSVKMLLRLGVRLWRSFIAGRIAKQVSLTVLRQILADFRKRGLVE